MSDLTDALWEKYAHPDRHGYKDFMSPGGFEAAVEEVLRTARETEGDAK